MTATDVGVVLRSREETDEIYSFAQFTTLVKTILPVTILCTHNNVHKLRFIADLCTLLKESNGKRQDIVITGDFNDVIGDSFNPLTKLIQEFDLRDVHAFNHGYDYDIATYFRGSR